MAKKTSEMYIHAKNWKMYLEGGMRASVLTLLGEKFFQPKTLKDGLKKGKILKIELRVTNKKHS